MVAVLRNAQKKTWRRREKDGEVKKDDVIICLRGHEVGCDSTMFAMFLAVSVFLVSNTMTQTTNTARHCSIGSSVVVPNLLGVRDCQEIKKVTYV